MNYTIGIDLGGTNTRIGLVAEDGKVIEVLKFKTYEHKELNDFVETLSDNIVSIAQKHNLPK